MPLPLLFHCYLPHCTYYLYTLFVVIVGWELPLVDTRPRLRIWFTARFTVYLPATLRFLTFRITVVVGSLLAPYVVADLPTLPHYPLP